MLNSLAAADSLDKSFPIPPGFNRKTERGRARSLGREWPGGKNPRSSQLKVNHNLLDFGY